MQFGTVTGRILATIADRVTDPDVNPDVVPVGGKVVFTPSVSAAISSSEGAIVLPTPIEAVLDSEGYLSLNGERGVSLVATDSPDLNPTGFTYTVTFADLQFDKFKLTYKPFSIAVPAGQTVDLSTLTPVGSSNGTIIIRGEKGEPGAPGGTFTYDPDDGYYTAEDAVPIPSAEVAVTTTGTENVTVLKPSGDVRPGVWEWVHDAPAGYLFHLMTGQNASSASALIGMGIDNGGIGLFVNNKKTGVGISIQQNDSITSATAYGIYAHQLSKTAPLIHIDQDDGAAKSVRIISNESTTETKEVVEIITPGNKGGFISAKSGNVYWKSDIVTVDGARLRARPAYIGDNNNTVVEANSLRLSTWNGGAGGYWQKRITQNGQSLMIQGADGTSGGPDASATWLTSFEAKQVSGDASGTQIAFYGASPVSRQAAPGEATDAATTQTAVNAIRTALVNLGLLS